MTDVFELLWQASLQDIKQGYFYQQNSDSFTCLICGRTYINGIIYPHEQELYDAKKSIEVHIAECHGSAFQFLLNLDKRLSGLTDHQKTLLELFYKGYSDNEVAKTLSTGSVSTIRNHRFSLREKQKQAKIFLAIMELLNEQPPKKQAFMEIPRHLRNVDERFAITEQENEKILAAYFKHGLTGRLELFPVKEKKRVAILRHIIKFFRKEKKYTEKEVNDVLKDFYEDYVLLRRCLIEYGFIDRTPDGSSYWLKS